MNISFQGSSADLAIVREILSPWSLVFTEPSEADVNIAYGEFIPKDKNTVIIPSNCEAFNAWCRKWDLNSMPSIGTVCSVPITQQTTLSFTPEKEYFLSSNQISNCSPTHFKCDGNVILKMDVVQEFKSLVDKALNPKQSTMHRVLTGLPIPYGIAPARLRNYVMKADKAENVSLIDKLPVDALRYALVNSLEEASRKKIVKAALYRRGPLLLLTHDIETADGLKTAVKLKKIEEKYDLPSTWYIPSKRYEIDKEAVCRLSVHGEVGVHDTKHDGKLAHLSKGKITQRLTEAKQSLSNILRKPINGFRAPVLQHNSDILEAVHEAGFSYDTSIPTWEPKHPYTMSPHGIGTVYPLTLGALKEIPLTLPQDHQLLHVLGQEPRALQKTWGMMANTIRDLEGVCMFLVHPDYQLGANTQLYEEFINSLISDYSKLASTPSDLCSQMDV